MTQHTITSRLAHKCMRTCLQQHKEVNTIASRPKHHSRNEAWEKHTYTHLQTHTPTLLLTRTPTHLNTHLYTHMKKPMKVTHIFFKHLSIPVLVRVVHGRRRAQQSYLHRRKKACHTHMRQNTMDTSTSLPVRKSASTERNEATQARLISAHTQSTYRLSWMLRLALRSSSVEYGEQPLRRTHGMSSHHEVERVGSTAACVNACVRIFLSAHPNIYDCTTHTATSCCTKCTTHRQRAQNQRTSTMMTSQHMLP